MKDNWLISIDTDAMRMWTSVTGRSVRMAAYVWTHSGHSTATAQLASRASSVGCHQQILWKHRPRYCRTLARQKWSALACCFLWCWCFSSYWLFSIRTFYARTGSVLSQQAFPQRMVIPYVKCAQVLRALEGLHRSWCALLPTQHPDVRGRKRQVLPPSRAHPQWTHFR